MEERIAVWASAHTERMQALVKMALLLVLMLHAILTHPERKEQLEHKDSTDTYH